MEIDDGVQDLDEAARKAEVVDARWLLCNGIGQIVKSYRQHEPIFVLRAQDKFAPEIIEAWARALETEEHSAWTSKAQVNGAWGEEFVPSEKVRQAKAYAHQMRAWQEMNGRKTPD